MPLASLTFVTFVLWGSTARAAQPQAITLADAEARATTDDAPAIAQARGADVSARAGVGTAAAIDDPGLTVGTTKLSPRISADVDVVVPIFGQAIPAVRAAREQAAAADADVDVARLDARAAVDQAWFALWAAQQLANVDNESVDDATRLKDAVQARFDAGDVSRLDLLSAQAGLARAQAEAAGATAEVQAASAELAVRILLPADTFLRADDTGMRSLTSPLPPLEGFTAALAAHPEAAADSHRADAAEARLRAARANWLPRLGVDVGTDIGDPGLSGTDYRASMNVNLPIGGGHGPEVAGARGDSAAANAASRQGVAERSAALVRTWNEADAARARLAALDDVAVPAAKTAADLANEAYKAGEVDLQVVLAARADLAAVRRERVQAAVDSGDARTALLRAAGGDIHAPF